MKQAFLRSSVIVSDLLIYLPGLEEFELAEHLAMSSNVRQCLDLASKLGTKMGGAVYAAKSFAEAWQPLALLLWLLPPLVRPPSYYKFIQVQQVCIINKDHERHKSVAYISIVAESLSQNTDVDKVYNICIYHRMYVFE